MKREPELQRRPVALTIFRNIVRMIREDAKRAGLDKMTMAEINAEIDAARKEMHAKPREPVKRSLSN